MEMNWMIFLLIDSLSGTGKSGKKGKDMISDWVRNTCVTNGHFSTRQL
jgi:hypothetical protein